MEYFDIIHPDGSVIGRASRDECHGGSFLLHAVVHILVFDCDGRLILQKRSESKDIQPGKWDTSVGGHISSGENMQDALEREAAEELGIRGADFLRLYSYVMESDIERELVTTFRCVWKGPVRFDREEIDEIRRFTAEEIEERLGTGYFTPNFEEEWAYYCSGD